MSAAKAKKGTAKMQAKDRHYDVIISPAITEKATALSEQNKIVFRIRPDACKTEVKEAVEALFNVSVVKVNTINVAGKTKRFKGRLGTRSDSKKAIVTLAAGQSIDFASGVK